MAFWTTFCEPAKTAFWLKRQPEGSTLASIGYSGSQPLTIFPFLAAGGLLTHPVWYLNCSKERFGQMAFIYQQFNLTAGIPFNANPNATTQIWPSTRLRRSTWGTARGETSFQGWLLFNANYTFSKVFTDASGTGQTNFDPFVDINNPGYDRQRAAFDLTHVFNANFLFELPFGRGRRFHIENSILNHILGGWT